MNTKEKIIYESLNLFSKRGFASISVRDIAKAVGIRASSLYNHFDNKQDILDTIIRKYSQHIANHLNNFQTKKTSDIPLYKIEQKSNSGDYFLVKSVDVFKFYLEDDYVIKFRRLLTIEKYNNTKLAALYNKIFIDDMLNFQSNVFETLMNDNVFIKRDPYTLALQFYSPVFLLFYKFDSITDKERISLRNHILEFRDAYMMKG